MLHRVLCCAGCGLLQESSTSHRVSVASSHHPGWVPYMQRRRGSRALVCFQVLLCGMSYTKALPLRPHARAAGQLPLNKFLGTQDNSLKAALKADPGSEKNQPNTEPREVFGHWVEVVPTALPDPFLVAIAPAMAAGSDWIHPGPKSPSCQILFWRRVRSA